MGPHSAQRSQGDRRHALGILQSADDRPVGAQTRAAGGFPLQFAMPAAPRGAALRFARRFALRRSTTILKN